MAEKLSFFGLNILLLLESIITFTNHNKCVTNEEVYRSINVEYNRMEVR